MDRFSCNAPRRRFAEIPSTWCRWAWRKSRHRRRPRKVRPRVRKHRPNKAPLVTPRLELDMPQPSKPIIQSEASLRNQGICGWRFFARIFLRNAVTLRPERNNNQKYICHAGNIYMVSTVTLPSILSLSLHKSQPNCLLLRRSPRVNSLETKLVSVMFKLKFLLHTIPCHQ